MKEICVGAESFGADSRECNFTLSAHLACAPHVEILAAPQGVAERTHQRTLAFCTLSRQPAQFHDAHHPIAFSMQAHYLLAPLVQLLQRLVSRVFIRP
jgi:hypothetical protein